MSDDEVFNWAADAVIPQQDAIAVYEGISGYIVIRQQADFSREEDSIILLQKSHVPALIQVLREVMKG